MASGEDGAKFVPYQDLILQHAKSLVHSQPLREAKEITLTNRLCGDSVTVFLRLDASGAVEIAVVASGCALCRASGSIMAQTCTGLSVGKVLPLVARFQKKFATGVGELPASESLAALTALRSFATRSRCVLLPWEALLTLIAPAP